MIFCESAGTRATTAGSAVEKAPRCERSTGLFPLRCAPPLQRRPSPSQAWDGRESQRWEFEHATLRQISAAPVPSSKIASAGSGAGLGPAKKKVDVKDKVKNQRVKGQTLGELIGGVAAVCRLVWKNSQRRLM